MNRSEKRGQKEEYMTRLKGLYSMLILTRTLVLLCSPLLEAAEGTISKVPDPSGKYCHLRFPAIKPETLSWNRPVLKDPSEGGSIAAFINVQRNLRLRCRSWPKCQASFCQSVELMHYVENHPKNSTAHRA